MKTHTKIRGVKHQNEDGTDRQEILSRCSEGETLYLYRDPDNPQDKNAVEVRRSNGEKLGYLSRSMAEDIAPKIDNGTEVRAQIKNLTGGGKKSRGCNILVYTPWLYARKTPKVYSSGMGCGCLVAIVGIVLFIFAAPTGEPFFIVTSIALLVVGMWKYFT